MKKAGIIIGLLIVIAGLIYWLIQLFLTPLNFDAAREYREAQVIGKLTDLRTMQRAYRTKYQRFAGTFDELKNFVMNDSLILEKSEGSEDDSVAMARGLVKKVKFAVPVKDTIALKFIKLDKIDSLSYIPFSKQATSEWKQFKLDTGSIVTESSVTVPVLQIFAPYTDFLGDLDKQELINFRDIRIYTLHKDDGIKVGSLEVANNEAGNWE